MKTTHVLITLCACIAAMSANAAPPVGSAPVSMQNPGFYLPQPLPLANFKLVDQNGNAFTIDNFKRHWTLVAFGYTHCPDVCPMTMAQIRAVKKSLASLDDAMPLSVVFVSIDPQRDSAEALKKYANVFGNDFIGVGGDPQEVDAFAKQFKVKYAIASGTNDGYFIDHTSSVALITPRAQLRALFNVPLRPEAVAADVRHIVSTKTSF